MHLLCVCVFNEEGINVHKYEGVCKLVCAGIDWLVEGERASRSVNMIANDKMST